MSFNASWKFNNGETLNSQITLLMHFAVTANSKSVYCFLELFNLFWWKVYIIW